MRRLAPRLTLPLPAYTIFRHRRRPAHRRYTLPLHDYET